jgi:hypothetical protein
VHLVAFYLLLLLLRQSSDCNVTCHMIKARDTHWKNILFNIFCRKIKHSNAPQCYVIILPVIFDIQCFVSVWCICVLNATSFQQGFDVWNYVKCWKIRWHASVYCLVTLALSLTAAPQKESNIKLLTLSRLAVGVFFQLLDSPVVSVLWFLL